ncbi:MAG: AsmA family protein, partial [Pseudomonadota bacterium]
MNRFVVAVLALIVMLAAIVALAPMLIPASQYKGAIEDAATSALGREVSIGDDLSFTLFPQTAFRVSDLKVANAEGFDGATFVEMEAAEIGVKLLPVLSRRVEIKTFVLRKPVLNLARAADGSVNWNLASADAGDADGDASSETGAPGDVALNELSLGDVRI